MGRLRPGTRARLFEELRENVRNAVPFGLTFKPTGKLTAKEVERLEKSLADAFKIWAETWVYPWIDRIEEATTRTKRPVPSRRLTSGAACGVGCDPVSCAR